MATVRMPNGTVVFFPPDGAHRIQEGQETPGTTIYPPRVVQYVGQQVEMPSNQQNHRAGVLEKLLKMETKTLGTIQIMIGLIHIGFGAVSASLANSDYMPLATIGGYPFWGALFFIASGSLSVSSEKHLGLVKCSVGMNIMSSVVALIGIILFIAELSMNQIYNDVYYPHDPDYPHTDHRFSLRSAGAGLSILLLLFSLLEFCITVSAAHLGCRITCCNNDTATVFVPYTISEVAAVPADDNAVPPPYDDVPFSSMK